MPIAALVVVAGLFVLTKTADQFVIGAARLAYTLKISPIVIGAVTTLRPWRPRRPSRSMRA